MIRLNPNPEIRNRARACARARNRENGRSAAMPARNRTVLERSGPLLGADGQQIEDEHEHDSQLRNPGSDERLSRRNPRLHAII
jgi:hypothetical protein